MFQKLDHIAIARKKTEETRTVYRDPLRLPVLLSKVLDEVGVQLTHLDRGNVLQLVEFLSEEPPIAKFIEVGGEGMHLSPDGTTEALGSKERYQVGKLN